MYNSYKGRTIIIIVFLEGEKKLWATEIYQMLRSDDIEDICIALQDILFVKNFIVCQKSYTMRLNQKYLSFCKNGKNCLVVIITHCHINLISIGNT